MKITKVTFLANKRASKAVKDISYLVNQTNNIIAVSIAKKAFLADNHNTGYYKEVLITQERVL